MSKLSLKEHFSNVKIIHVPEIGYLLKLNTDFQKSKKSNYSSSKNSFAFNVFHTPQRSSLISSIAKPKSNIPETSKNSDLNSLQQRFVYISAYIYTVNS